MSTDRKRLNSAIQRIAREDPEIRKLLDDFRNSGGKPSEPATSGSGAEDRQICCDGGTSGSTNPGSDTRDTSDGGQDGLNADDPALLDSGPGSLTGVTDCATGEPLCFDGSGFIPPDGWDGPSDPPPDDTWVQGFYWEVNWETSFSGPGTDYYSGKPNICGYAPCGFGCGGGTFAFSVECSGESYAAARGQVACDPENDPPEVQAVCVDEAPPIGAWPEDGCVNLSISGGKIVGSKYDPENVGGKFDDNKNAYSAPRDELEVCDSSGNRILLRGSPTGGWKSIKSLSGDIDPDTGNGYLYRPNGQRVRQISPSEFRDDTV